MKAAFMVPVYKDDRGKCEELFINKMVPSFQHLDYDLCPIDILFNYQGFTTEEINSINSKINEVYGGKIKYAVNSYTPPVSMSKIREDTCSIDPTYDIYVCADDDMRFGKNSAESYLKILNYMRDNPKCGAVMAMGYLGGYHNKGNIVQAVEAMWWTNRGLFLRNLPEVPWLFCEHDVLKYAGTLEETYSVYCRFTKGYTGAKLFNVDTYHRATTIDETFDKYSKRKNRYSQDIDLHNPKYSGIKDAIREKWGDPKWEFNQKRLPIKLKEIMALNLKQI